MNSMNFKTKADAKEFIRNHGGYYECMVDEHMEQTYIVFYK